MRALSLEHFNELVDAVYQAGLDGGKWEPFLTHLSKLGAVWIAIQCHDHDLNTSVGALCTKWDPYYFHQYLSEYAAINPWLAAANVLPIGKAQPSEALVPEHELIKSRFYNEWIRPQEDIRTGAGITLCRNQSKLVRMSCNIRACDREKLQPQLLTLLDLLAPHLRRAVSLLGQLGTQRLGAQAPIFESDTEAIFLVDSNLCVRSANSRAETLRVIGDVVYQEAGGRLCFRDPVANAALVRAVGAIIARDYFKFAGPIRARSQNGEVSLVATVSPFSLNGETATTSLDGAYKIQPIALLHLSPAMKHLAKGAQELTRMFGLTPTEAQLAIAIFRGETLRNYADQRGISVQTARKQLATVFDKMSVSKQSQLVSLIATMSGLLF